MRAPAKDSCRSSWRNSNICSPASPDGAWKCRSLGGGIGTRGPGETQLETDRRKIYRRIRHVKEQLESVRRIRGQQRQRRESVPVAVVALVGYTNAGQVHAVQCADPRRRAGKSAHVRHARSHIAAHQAAVEARSTCCLTLWDSSATCRTRWCPLFAPRLEEVQRATLLLHVADVTSPTAAEQQAQVEDVLRELEVQDKPRLYVMNKLDLLPELKRESLIDSANVVHVSAAKGIGMERLLQRIDELIDQDPVRQVRLQVPQSEGKALATLDAKAVVLSREYRDGYVELEVQAPASVLRQMSRLSSLSKVLQPLNFQ